LAADPIQVVFAQQRDEAKRLAKIRFVTGDFRELEFSPAVDAIIGRFVLINFADPFDAQRRALRNLRAGGVIARD
jgi:ubiquinone/menaquinone biosynthesis C-methylase UbiE